MYQKKTSYLNAFKYLRVSDYISPSDLDFVLGKEAWRADTEILWYKRLEQALNALGKVL